MKSSDNFIAVLNLQIHMTKYYSNIAVVLIMEPDDPVFI